MLKELGAGGEGEGGLIGAESTDLVLHVLTF